MVCRFPSVPLAVALTAVLVGSSEAYGRFAALIPNGEKVEYLGKPCPGVGHQTCEGGIPGGDLAPEGVETVSRFGSDFEDQNNTWTTVVCMADSDGDGVSNGMELGDPDCTWTPGTTPKRTTNITHPGVAEGRTTTNYAYLTATTTTTTTARTAVSAAGPIRAVGVSLTLAVSCLRSWC